MFQYLQVLYDWDEERRRAGWEGKVGLKGVGGGEEQLG